MDKPAIIVLTSDTRKWSFLHSYAGPAYDCIISDNVISLRQISNQKEVFLLIISVYSQAGNTLNIQSISQAIGAGLTIIVAPDFIQAGIQNTLRSIAALLVPNQNSQPENTPVAETRSLSSAVQSVSDREANRKPAASRWAKVMSRFANLGKQNASVAPPQSEVSQKPPTPQIYRPIIPERVDDANLLKPAPIIHTAGFSPQLIGQLMGPFHVLLNGVLIDSWTSKKGKSLLAYLLYHRKKTNLRDALMEKFWPGVSQESARNSLNVALHGIRRAFKRVDDTRDYIIFDSNRYFVNPELPIELDCETFMTSWSKAQQIERVKGLPEAISAYEKTTTLYRGDFIADELFDEWVCTERETIKEAYLFSLERLSTHYTTCRQYERAAELCEQVLQKDICRENVHRRLMRCYYHSGQRDKAIRQFHKCTEALKQELEVTPSQTTHELFLKIAQESNPN